MLHPTKLVRGTTAALAVAFLLCAGAVFLSEDTDAETTINGFTYTLSGTDAVLTGHEEGSLPADGKLTIPASVTDGGKTYTVTAIDNFAFSNCTALTEVTIPGTVAVIDSGAFEGCTALTKLNLSEGLMTIGLRAFEGCTALTEVAVPASVTSYDRPFLGCTALTAFTVANGNASYCAVDGILYSKDLKTLVQCPGSFTAVNIPASVTAIADRAFDSCKLTAVTVPDTVTSLGSDLFYNCTALTTATIGSNADCLDWSTFEGCTALTAVTIGEKVSNINFLAFKGCTALTSLTVAAGNQYYCAVDNVVYTKDMKTLVQSPLGLSEVTIADGITAIGEWAFAYSKVTMVTIPDTVTEIGAGAFIECMDLKALYVGSGVESIGEGGFDGCKFYQADGTVMNYSDLGGHWYKTSTVGDKMRFTLYDGHYITVAATDGGTTTGSGLYADKTTVTVTATAADGYSFAGWYSGETKVSDEAQYEFWVHSDETITAHFSENTAEPSGSSNTWIWIAVIVVVVLAVLLAVYFLFIRTGKLKL